MHHTITVPYYPQSTDHTCGPASLRMLLAYLGIERDEHELAEHLRTCEVTGTRRRAIIDYLTQVEQIAHRVFTQQSIADLARRLTHGTPILVRYVEPTDEEDHYALVVGMNKTEVILHDPYEQNGEHFTLEHTEFERRWTEYYGDKGGWMLTL